MGFETAGGGDTDVQEHLRFLCLLCFLCLEVWLHSQSQNLNAICVEGREGDNKAADRPFTTFLDQPC